MLAAAARVLAELSCEERDELLEALVVGICNNPGELQPTLLAYLREHEFGRLVARLYKDSERSERGEAS